MKKFEIKKVRRQGDKKIVTIPSESDISVDDYVVIKKYEEVSN